MDGSYHLSLNTLTYKGGHCIVGKSKNSLSNRRRKRGTRRYELAGISLFVAGLFVCISLSGQNAGILGSWVGDTFRFFFGLTALIPGLCMMGLGFRYIYKGTGLSITRREWLWWMLYVLLLSWIHHVYVLEGREMDIDAIMGYGGILGGVITLGLHIFLGTLGTTVFLAGLTIAGVLLMTHWSLTNGAQMVGEKTGQQVRRVQTVIQEKKAEWDERRAMQQSERPEDSPTDFLFRKKKENPEETLPVEPEPEERVPDSPIDTIRPMEEKVNLGGETAEKKPEEPPEVAPEMPKKNGSAAAAKPVSSYHFPPISLLHSGKGSTGSALHDARENVNILESTLKSFGVDVKITDVSVGPTVTRYELEPAPGVKVSRITGLQDDIALQLAATHIRIEAPIPGKSAVGIEVPNAKTMEVPLRDVLDDKAFKEKRGGVPVALGKDITGKTVVTDLTKMPHLLIAGSTGSGKSVCINTIITSILYHEQPDEVKLILIDPKVVELSVYNGIPHLRIPVVTEAKKAAGALHWAVKEMEARYQNFSLSHVRDIGGYNKAHPDQHMPFIIIIIDELADLMMAAPDSVEDAICRLAQKARAAGIHLVLATQRPSVDVITGVIKANIPSRISFAVSSQVDSRTILDMAGAEKLIGKGDMLFNPIGAPNPIRVQGAFISDDEVEKVTAYIKAEVPEESVKYEAINLELPEKPVQTEQPEEEDELLQEAAEWILDTKKASVSMLQRRFRIGYTRAGRLMDTLEGMGIVGPAEGAKPREVLMTKQQAEEKFWSGDSEEEKTQIE